MSCWVHCNNCYKQPENGTELRFYLTNCSHLFCENCVPHCAKEQCKVCKSQCSTLLLSGKMPKDIDAMFKDPMESIQRFFKQVHQIMEFQKGQQRRLIRHLRGKINLCAQQTEEIKNIIKQSRSLERENIQLKRQNQYLSTVAKKESPCSFRNYNQLASKVKSPSDFPYSANIGVGRLLVRTPPSGGRMGVGMSDSPMSTGVNTPSSYPRPLLQLFSD